MGHYAPSVIVVPKISKARFSHPKQEQVPYRGSKKLNSKRVAHACLNTKSKFERVMHPWEQFSASPFSFLLFVKPENTCKCKAEYSRISYLSTIMPDLCEVKKTILEIFL
jgi:hypothetical protein